MNKLDYDASFFELQGKTNISSAKRIVPLVLSLLNKEAKNCSVIDLGCGTGNWLSVFKANGCDVLGVDGGVQPEQLMIDLDEFMPHDFREPFHTNRKFDLAVSLECAEHIPEENSDSFLESLVALSDVILFSAAIPHQRGRGHINEQYQQYWIDKFDNLGYQYYDVLRRKIWNCDDVRAFYAQNIFIYIKRDSQYYCDNRDIIEKCNESGIVNMVHPGIWEDINSYKIVRMMDKMHKNPLISWFYYKFIKKYIKFN